MTKHTLSYDQLRNSLTGEAIVLPTELTSSQGFSIVFECQLFRSKTTSAIWILTTALAKENPIGFIDIRYQPAIRQGVVFTPHHWQTGEHLTPHQNIREQAHKDGFFFHEQERSRGIGAAIMNLTKKTLTTLGAKQLLIKDPSERSKSFYERHGGKLIGKHFQYDLNQKV